MKNEIRIERKNQTIIIRRNHVALKNAKVAVNSNVYSDDLFQSKLANCKTQAAVIQICIENKKTFAFTSNLLVTMNLCKSENDAMKRIKRHTQHDVASRIVSRTLHINQ